MSEHDALLPFDNQAAFTLIALILAFFDFGK
jgi:hypothetical protein